MKPSDGAKAGHSSSSVRLSRKLGTHSPENKCVWEPAPPVTPSSPASLPLGFQPPSFYTVHAVSTACCLASLAPPFQAHSPFTHTRTLSAVAASLFTSRVCRPATSQTQRSPAREGEAPGSGCPLHGALALGPDNPGFRSREKGHKICP